MTRLLAGLLVLVFAISGSTRAAGACPGGVQFAGSLAVTAALGQTLTVPAAAAPAATFDVAPPLGWVKPIDPDAVPLPKASDGDGGYEDVLIDDQKLVEPVTSFTHRTVLVTSDQGIATASEIRADFNPSYQTLTVNTLRVKRDGAWSDRLHNDSFQLAPREHDADQQVLDGRFSAVCHLQDVRTGDLIDYAYTIKGGNPVFGSRFVDSFPMAFPRPVELFSTQVSMPPGHDMSIKGLGGAPDPVQTKLPDGSALLAWSQKEVPASVIAPGTPPWYDPIPWVEMSEFKTWNDVADWASDTFSVSAPLTSELQQKVDDIKSTYNLPESRALAAINFVQDNIRYLDTGGGANSYRTISAQQVMDRGFGDSKDKAQLCATLLHALGFPAQMALVNTTRGDATDDLLPSPLDFDHAIVSFSIDDTPYWVDASRTGQRGQLRDFAVSDFKRALLVAPETDTLSSVTVSLGSQPQVTAEEAYDVPSVTDPATLRIHTTYLGSAAEDARNAFNISSHGKLQKDYLDYYAQVYPQIEVETPVRVQDHPNENRFEVWESYTIPGLWTRASEKAPYQAHFVPFAVLRVAGTPAPMPRKIPYRIAYPADVTENMEISLFDSWPLDPPPPRMKLPNFTFSLSSQSDGGTQHFQYHYQAMAPDVNPEDLAKFNDAASRVGHLINYQLAYTPGVSPGSFAAVPLNWNMVRLFGTIFGGMAAICLGLCFVRRNKPLDDDYYEIAEFDGIGGWLVFVCVMIVLGLASYGRSAFLDLSVMLDQAKWDLLTRPGNDLYDPNWGGLLLFDGTASMIFIVLLLTGVVLMVLKRFTFPYFMIAVLILILIFNIIGFNLAATTVALLAHPAFAAGVIPLAIVIASTLIWIPYFLFSRRVKATFRS